MMYAIFVQQIYLDVLTAVLTETNVVFATLASTWPHPAKCAVFVLLYKVDARCVSKIFLAISTV